jgi:two-component system, LuxR family, sensor kinase FixL
MSWITFIWSLTAGICLTLGAVHFLVWTRQRDQWANLAFSISAIAAAGYAVFDLLALRAQTPAEYGAWMRWMLLLGMVEGVLIAGFVRLYLRAGRLWLLWLICGLRALMLVFNFVSGPNFYFREITGLHQTPLLGEPIAHPHGLLHPWAMLMQLSLLLLLIFVADAGHTASKRDGRRRAGVLGGLVAGGFALALLSYALYARGFLPSTFSSQLFLSLILVMGYELSLDVLRAGQLSRELFESQRRMRMAASAADLSIWEWDIVRDEIWTTEKGRERAGIDPSERIDFARFLRSVHPDDREPTQQAVRDSLEGGGEFKAEYRMTARDSVTRWVANRGQVERDAQGKALRLRGVSVDVTERKQAEAELRRLQSEVAHVSRVSTMGQLSTALAHELNQPLGAILSNAEAAEMLLDADPPALGQVREILADIRKDDERAGEVIRRMRTLLRKRELEMQPLELGDLVRNVLRLVSGDAAMRKVTVRAEIDSPSLPIRGDRVHLQQVLLNLLVNGLDAVAGNQPEERCVRVQAGRNRIGEIEVSVRDNGPGIPADQLARLFEPFFTTKPDGMGMGISIARTIVQAHNGHIWAENNPDGGATFRFTLPAAEDAGKGTRDEGRGAKEGGKR